MKLGAFEVGESQLSFALLFMSIRAFSEKKNYPKFSLHVLGRNMDLLFRYAVVVPMLAVLAAVIHNALALLVPVAKG